MDREEATAAAEPSKGGALALSIDAIDHLRAVLAEANFDPDNCPLCAEIAEAVS